MVASSASLLSGICNIVTTKLDDNNFPTWLFQMQSLLRGHGLLRFVDGSLPCPSQYVLGEDGRLSPSADYEAWMEQDSTLISLLIATLSSEALAQVVGCTSAMEVWTTLKERYATVSRSNVVQLKSNLQSIEKGSDRIEKYLLRVKTARDQLADSTLISLLIATLSSEALAQVVGCTSAMEVWTTLKERYATVSRSNVVQLKSNLQSIEKGSDRIEKYLLRVKTARDQLAAIGVQIADEDIMILILKGLPSEFSTVRFMIKAKTSSITMAELRSLLLAAESEIESESKSLSFGSLTALVAKNATQDSKGLLPTPDVGYTGYAASHIAPRNGIPRGYMTNSSGHGQFRSRNSYLIFQKENSETSKSMHKYQMPQYSLTIESVPLLTYLALTYSK